MIFISGVHGVGKSYFCDIIKERLGMDSYPASQLIAEKRKAGFDKDKLIPDIDKNQQFLLAAVDELRNATDNFILDGHFCLLDASGAVTRIGLETFTDLHPEAIILLTEKPEIICQRRKDRDNVDVTVESIAYFQTEEEKYAEEVSQLIGAKLFISSGSGDLDNTIEFLKSL